MKEPIGPAPGGKGFLRRVAEQGLGGAAALVMAAAISAAGGALVASYLSMTVPQGAVVAFDRDGECPAGWRPYGLAAGSFIRGVDRNPNREPPATFGGEGGGQNLEGTQTTLVQGESGVPAFVYTNEPDRLPPYITLQFCTPD